MCVYVCLSCLYTISSPFQQEKHRVSCQLALLPIVFHRKVRKTNNLITFFGQCFWIGHKISSSQAFFNDIHLLAGWRENQRVRWRTFVW